VLFAFPSRYWFTIGQRLVFSLTGWSPWIQAGFLVPRLTQVPASSLDRFRLRVCHPLWISFPEDSANNQIGNSTYAGPTTPETPKCHGFGLFRFRSPLLSESRFLSPPGGTEMVHFPPFACSQLCIHWDIPGFCPGGFPHSEISGSTPVCGSPKLIAACHVLHRLFLPRHPPCALSSLTIEFTRTQQRSNLCNLEQSTF
jgi:hypothetical protein